MTICNKIQTVGETMETNLNARGVSCIFGTGTNESTILDMVEMVNSTNFKGSSDVNLKIGANRPYLLTGETTDVVVRLEDGLCEPLKNKNVTIKQSIFIDNGTTASYNDHWYINSYGTATVQSNGTKLLNTSGTASFVMRHIIPSNKTISDANAYSYSPPFVVEFDIVETNGTSDNNAQVQIYSEQTTVNFAQAVTTGHYKITVTSEEQKIWVDDTLIKTTNLSLPNARITLRARNSKYLIYKNFKVYEIINGVTDEKGEFALYNVSVTDNTTFTASYGTETATCLVEYCTFVDYATTSKHNDNYTNYAYLTRSDAYTIASNTSGSVKLLDTMVSSNSLYVSSTNYEVCITILEVTGSDNRIRLRSDATSSNYWDFILTPTSVGQYRFVYDGTNHTIKRYRNGVLQNTIEKTLGSNKGCTLRIENNGSLKYCDLRVKSL